MGSANLFFLPAASKIKARLRLQLQRKELILEGVVGIVEGLNPKLIRARLEAFTGESGTGDKERQPRREASAA